MCTLILGLKVKRYHVECGGNLSPYNYNGKPKETEGSRWAKGKHDVLWFMSTNAPNHSTCAVCRMFREIPDKLKGAVEKLVWARKTKDENFVKSSVFNYGHENVLRKQSEELLRM